MEAERNSETDKCIDHGWYESPIYTVDTVSPIITEVFCDQYPVRKKEDRQYFKNVPEIIIRIQEENFNKANFSLDKNISQIPNDINYYMNIISKITKVKNCK